MMSAVFTLDKREVCVCWYLEQLKGVPLDSSTTVDYKLIPPKNWGNLESLRALGLKVVSCHTVPDQELLSGGVRNQVCGFWGLCGLL